MKNISDSDLVWRIQVGNIHMVNKSGSGAMLIMSKILMLVCKTNTL